MFRIGSVDVEFYMCDILCVIVFVLNGIFNCISFLGYIDDFFYVSGEKGYSNWEFFVDWVNVFCCELMVGGLDSGKVLCVVGMVVMMCLSDCGFDDVVNCCISLLVLNK